MAIGNVEDMVPTSDTEQSLMAARGQADCRECSAHRIEPTARSWYWVTEERKVLCEVCEGCGLMRLFDASVILRS